MKYDIIVLGAGHAGVEASFVASKFNLSVLFITMDKEAIGRMSCNPALGGLGKGHLIQEIDAMGGLMPRAADASALQYKTLNKSKGRAVWSLRAQIDKLVYPKYIQKSINACSNITILEDEVVDFNVDNLSITSVILKSNLTIKTKSLIVCSGTFLNGLIHIGNNTFSAGRFAEKPAIGLTQALVNKGFVTKRLKTGTPPRLLSNSIDWKQCEPAMGDDTTFPFSIFTKTPYKPKNVPCYIANTNKNVHEILNQNLDCSAMYSGKISGVGPRYCPSIEDKIVRFKQRPSHQLFLEPEWYNSNQIYLNGFSTSMPKNIQEQALKEMPPFKAVSLIRPGYAIEYDYFPTRQLKSTLESKQINGLYFAGQLNGTSGYEEAAAQGFMAGLNCSLKILNKDPFVLKRNEAYIGVLIDDLITKDIDEPYRMFTSRAEHRLSLRGDNAALRLTEKANKIGIISKPHYNKFIALLSSVNDIKKNLLTATTRAHKKSITFTDYIKRPGSNILKKNIAKKLLKKHDEKSLFIAETDIKYEGYVKIENDRVEKIKKMEHTKIPQNINYKQIKGLSNESRDKLALILPETLGQASRIAGVRPSDLAILSLSLKNFLP